MSLWTVLEILYKMQKNVDASWQLQSVVEEIREIPIWMPDAYPTLSPDTVIGWVNMKNPGEKAAS
jgi:hypothetical protein